MNILAIDTATVLCSAALQCGDVVIRRDAVITGKHSTLIFRQIEQVLAEADLTRDLLDAVVLSAGPGSFTGLRVGASAVKGFLFGSDVPLYAGSTLAGYALCAVADDFSGRVHAVIDARRQHLYAAGFSSEGGGFSSMYEAGIEPIATLSQRFRAGDVVIGTGVDRLPSDVAERVTVMGPEFLSAAGLLKLVRVSGVLDGCADGNVAMDGAYAGLIRRVHVGEFEPEYMAENNY
jgi:tRNA threonylcarbamoyladenosine biosynthesis protein TsaB